MEHIKKLIGTHIREIFLQQYFCNNSHIGIIQIFLYDNSLYYGIICSEGNVMIHTTEDCPESICDNDCKYLIERLNKDWINGCTITSISFVCSHEWRNGIAISFDNGHNIVFYNTGYEDGDEDIFEVDADIQELDEKYKLVDVLP